MAKHKKHNHSKKVINNDDLKSTYKQLDVIKRLLLSLILVLVASISYMIFADMLINSIDEKAAETSNIPQITEMDISSHVITINGVKSPSLDIEVELDKPGKVIVEISADDYFKRLDGLPINTEHNLNLFLPEDLIGENIELTFNIQDSLKRTEIHRKNYTIPALVSNVVLVN
ncbi:hypothetical protein C0585_01360 [Candidatus Woesearchaeota archaeon]|nr:MAG: hypothetical protein C0585_01360 [Candidatus Woesearchaeota archaeon]